MAQNGELVVESRLNKSPISVKKNCFDCKRRLASCSKQQMADLPSNRVTPSEPPFTNVGLDYFGPLNVEEVQSKDMDVYLHA